MVPILFKFKTQYKKVFNSIKLHYNNYIPFQFESFKSKLYKKHKQKKKNAIKASTQLFAFSIFAIVI